VSKIVLRGGQASTVWGRFQQNLERLKRVGLGQWAAEKRQRARYLLARWGRDSKAADAKWRSLAGAYEGQRAFLIGNGPSLNKTPLYLLRDEHKISFNRFYLMLDRLNWDIEFHAIVDDLLINDMIGEMDGLSRTARHLFLPDIHIRGDTFYDKIADRDNLYWMRYQAGGNGFSASLPAVWGGGSVIFEGFQILRFLGFREIAMVGVDLRFQAHTTAVTVAGAANGIVPVKDDDPNHFDPRYFGAGRRYHNPKDEVIQRIRSGLDDVAAVMPRLGFHVTNVGYDSSVESFDRMDFQAYLGKTPEETRALFEDLIRKTTRLTSLPELESATRPVATADELRGASDGVVAPVSIAAPLVGSKVLTHVALGPYLDRLYFIPRDR